MVVGAGLDFAESFRVVLVLSCSDECQVVTTVRTYQIIYCLIQKHYSGYGSP